MKPAVGPLGEYLRDFRKRERYTISLFARHAGLSKSQVFGIEHGTENNVRIKTVIALAKAMGTTVSRVATLAAASHDAAMRQEGGTP